MDIEEYEDDPLNKPVNIEEFFFDGSPIVNVAGFLSKEDLDKIGQKCLEKYQSDCEAISEAKDMADKIFDIYEGRSQPKNYPFPNAANVIFPLLTGAVNKCCSFLSPAIFTGGDVVKVQPFGFDKVNQVDPQAGQMMPQQLGKKERAERLTIDMNYQFLHEDKNWEVETEAMLRVFALQGGFWRKRYYDPQKRANCSTAYKQYDVVVHPDTPLDLTRAPAISHPFSLYLHEVKHRVADGRFLDEEIDDVDDYLFEFIEQYCYLDLDGDGVQEPYYVTFQEESGVVFRIYPAYDTTLIQRDDLGKIIYIEPRLCWIYYSFMPDPRGKFYGRGLGNLLFHINVALNSVINRLLDAGTLANTQSGFIGGGLRIPSGVLSVSPGEWRQLSADGQTISQNIVPLNFKEPSLVLFQLLGMMIEYGKDIANMRNVMSGDAPMNAPATTTLALIEQGIIEYKDIYRRFHRSLKKEAELVFQLSRLYRTDEQYQKVLDDPQASVMDYREDGSDVMPETDPSVISHFQKMARLQAMQQFVGDPETEQRELRLRLFDGYGFERPDELLAPIPQPVPPPPPSPLEVANYQFMLTQIKKLEADILAKEDELNISRAKAEAEIKKTNAMTLKSGAEAMNELGLAEEKEQQTNDLPEYLAILRNIQQMLERQSVKIEDTNGTNEQINARQMGVMAGGGGNEATAPIPTGANPEFAG